MAKADPDAVEALIVALPESAGSAIYGLVDVFASTGTLWRELIGDEPGRRLIRPRIVSVTGDPFLCGNGIPVRPDLAIKTKSDADIVIVPELWLAPNDDLTERYEELKEWLRQRYRAAARSTRPAPVRYCWRRQACSTAGKRRRTGPMPIFSVGAFPRFASFPSRTSSSPIMRVAS